MKEIITGGWLEGETIRDDIIINGQTNRLAFKDDITNANTVKRLRERGHVKEVKQKEVKKDDSRIS